MSEVIIDVGNNLIELVGCEYRGELVRCKECRFGQWHEQAEEYICIAHDQDLFDGDHFCSYGVRKEGEQ